METALTWAVSVVLVAVLFGVAIVGYARTTGRVVRQHVGPDSWAAARVDRAAPGGALVGHRGLQVGLVDGSTEGFLLPSRTTLRYPPELLDRALQEVARHRPVQT